MFETTTQKYIDSTKGYIFESSDMLVFIGGYHPYKSVDHWDKNLSIQTFHPDHTSMMGLISRIRYIPRLPNTKREEVFRPQKHTIQTPFTSGGIWKTRVYTYIINYTLW